jgi:3-oxoacyl-[acyl-carrier-protein] synthase-3
MSAELMDIGLASFGLYLPPETVGAVELAKESGLSLEQLESLGIQGRCQPSPGDQPIPMAARAAAQALERGGLDPQEVDLVLWTGEEYKDYIAQTASIRLQEEVGCKDAWAFDLVGQGITPILGLRIARDLMIGDETVNTVLLAGGTRNLDLVDPLNPDTRFLLPYSASGAAAVLQRGLGRNRLLSATVSTEPGLADEVYVPGGGTEIPFALDNLGTSVMYFNVQHPEVVDAYLVEQFPARLAQEVRRNLGGRPLDYLALRHLPPGSRGKVLAELGLGEGQSAPLYQWGHHGGNDAFISLERGLASGAVSDGSLVGLASGGIGFTYAAAALQWGPAPLVEE